MSKKISFKQILLVWLFATSFYSFRAAPAIALKLSSQTANAPTKNIKANLNDATLNKSTEHLLLTKKSGGRSGGGSFKRSSPTRSKSSSSTPSRSYRSPSRSSSSPSRSSSSSHSSSFGEDLVMGVFVFIFFIGFIGVLVLIGINNNGTGLSSSKNSKSGYDRERDNDRVTVSMLQVVLNSGDIEHIKESLNELSIQADTSTNEGLVELMQEAVMLLLRNEATWSYVFSSSQSLDISEAESTFDSISILERSKFSNETLKNVDGKLKNTEQDYAGANREQAYIVITLIAGTADDNPLFEKLYTAQNLKDALCEIAVMRDDYLMKFELLWTPQLQNEYLTEDELLTEYSSLIFLG